jgi:hypothetical protein
MLRISFVAAVVAALFPASAAARWSPPATLTAAVGQAADPAPDIAVSGTGTALAVWSPRNSGVALAVGNRRGHFGHPRLLARHGHSADVAVAGDGSALIAWADRGRVFLVERSARGRLGTPRAITPRYRATITGPYLAVAADGEAVIAWTSGARPGTTWAAMRSPTGSVTAPQRLGSGFIDTFGAGPVRTDVLGAAAVAFLAPASGGNALMVARRPAHAAAFAPAVTVSGPPVTEPALAVGYGGDVTAAWIVGQGFESDFDGPLVVAASPFTGPPASGPPQQRAFAPRVVSLGFGDSVIAWQDRGRDTLPTLLNGPIRTAKRHADGTIEPARTLDANPLARRPRLEPLSPFRALAVWTSTPAGSRRLVWRAAVAGTDGRFVRVRAPHGRAPSFTRGQELATARHYAALVWLDGRRIRASVGHL